MDAMLTSISRTMQHELPSKTRDFTKPSVGEWYSLTMHRKAWKC